MRNSLFVAEVTEVIDPDDDRLADFRDLTRADRRPDRPGGRGLVLAEGVVVVRRLLASPYPVRAVLGVRRKVDELAAELSGLDARVYAASADLMAQVVGFHLNRGVLASADRAPPADVTGLVSTARTLAVLEGINDHENLGALFRNAAALGVDGVLLGARCADPLYRRSVRVSMGHVLSVPFATMARWPADLDMLRRNGFRIVALTPRAGSVPLDRARLAGEVGSVPLDVARLAGGVGSVPLDVARLAGARVALMLGAEGPGLSPDALAAADELVGIPMAGGVDSLNVATAAAIAFYAVGLSRPPDQA
jgi:tRNA G18 (ribose-2'-O)-methylase SpoU